MIDLEKIRECLSAATPGPWEAVQEQCGPDVWSPTGEITSKADPVIARVYGREANLSLITNAPTVIAALIEEVERLREDRDKWRDASQCDHAIVEHVRGNSDPLLSEVERLRAERAALGVLAATGLHLSDQEGPGITVANTAPERVEAVRDAFSRLPDRLRAEIGKAAGHE